MLVVEAFLFLGRHFLLGLFSLAFWTLVLGSWVILKVWRGLVSLWLGSNVSLATHWDSIFAHKTLNNQVLIHGYTVFEGTPPTLPSLKRELAHLIDTEPALQKLRLRLGSKGGFDCWRLAPNFNPANHVKELPSAPTSITPSRLYRLMEKLEGLDDPEQPEWDIWLLPKFIREGDCEGGDWGVLLRLHHAYSDGINILLLADLILGAGRPLQLPVDPRQGLRLSAWKNVLLHLKCVYSGPYYFLRHLCWPLLSDKSDLRVKKYAVRKWYAVSSTPIPLSSLKSLKGLSGTSVTAVFLSAIASTLAKSHRAAFGRTANLGTVQAIGPYTPQLANQFAGYNIEVPLGLGRREGLERTWEVFRRRMGEGLPLFVYYFVYLWGDLPCSLKEIVSRTLGGAPIMFSNVPGPINEFRVNGATLVHGFGWIPLVSNTAIGITCISYAGNVWLGGIGDSGALPSRKLLQEFLDNVAEEILQLSIEYESEGKVDQ